MFVNATFTPQPPRQLITYHVETSETLPFYSQDSISVHQILYRGHELPRVLESTTGTEIADNGNSFGDHPKGSG